MVVPEIIAFDKEPVTPSIIMVAGVGGGGSNAVNHMFDMGIAKVTFMICNTDRQALGRSPVPIKVRLGEHLTEGLGAGNNPERGRAAAVESLDEIVSIFRREGTRMVFITAGMGGGTGTGAAPVIARAARENGILTVGIVTLPFKAEGKARARNAMEGLGELRKYVDALLVINNENIQEIYGKLPITDAFHKADDILATGAKGIAEIITREGLVNVDFADVSTVMRQSGIAQMGSGRASGEGRAQKAADLALSSPLLNHNDIEGARNILLNISWGEEEISFDDMYSIVEYVQQRTGAATEADIIFGAGNDPSLGKDIEITLIATGFSIDENTLWGGMQKAAPQPTVRGVHDPGGYNFTQPDAPGIQAPGEDPTATAVSPKRPWTRPQTDKDPHAFWENTPPAPQPRQLQKDPDFAAPRGTVIVLKDNGLYDDLRNIEDTPGYVRRKARMVVDSGAKGVRTVIKEDAAPEPPAQDGGSLFD